MFETINQINMLHIMHISHISLRFSHIVSRSADLPIPSCLADGISRVVCQRRMLRVRLKGLAV